MFLRVQPMTELSTLSLPTLAEMANEAAAACEQSARRTVQQAATCGRALLAAKEQIPHGEWMGWVRANFDYDHGQATRYMQVANYAQAHNLDDATSVGSVLRLIADERAAERAAANPEPAWKEPADMPPPEPPAAPKTIVDHKATAAPRTAMDRITNRKASDEGGLPDDVIKNACRQFPTERQQAPQKPVQATQQPAEPIEPEVVRETSVLVFQRRQMLRVGRLYILTPEGFDEVDP